MSQNPMAECRFLRVCGLVLFLTLCLVAGGAGVWAQDSLLNAPTPTAAAPAAVDSVPASGGTAVSPVSAATAGAPNTAPSSDLERFLALDPDTVKLTGLEIVDVFASAAVYPDAAGSQTAEQVANRYLRKDRPKFPAYIQTSPGSGPLWVVLSAYNQSGPTDWVLNFGERDTGRLGRIMALRIEEMTRRQVLFDQDVGQSATGARRVGHLVGSSILFDLPEGGAALLVMHITPDPAYPSVFPIRLMSGLVAPKDSGALSFFSWLVQGLALFGAGAALFVAMTSGRFALAYFALFAVSLPLALWVPHGLFADVPGDYHRFTLLILGVQSTALALSGWALARVLRLPFGSDLAHIGIMLAGVGTILVFVLFLKAMGSPAAWAMFMVGTAVAAIAGTFVMSYRIFLASGFLAMVGLFAFLAATQIMATGAVTPLGGETFINAVAFGTTAIVPVMLIVLVLTPVLDSPRVAVGAPASPTTEDDRDRERYQQLRLAKESFDYNNLLRVIEHERKQLAAARTREMVRSEEMRKAKDLADEANRAKSAFLAVVSHEIRTPMTGVMATVRLLEDTTLTKTQHEYAQTIKESGNAMMALLNDILDFEKIESGKMQLERVDFDLHRLLQGVITLMSGHATSKGIRLALDIDFSVPAVVVGDMVRLRQILLNLVGNAIKFTREGGVTLRVSATVDAELQEKENRLLHHVYFAVEDTGIGIPTSAQKNIFTPFSQADKSIARKFGGSGLGLAISKRLVEAMGSSLNIKSKEGQGTTVFFTIDLPEGDRSRLVETGPAPAPLQTSAVSVPTPDPVESKSSLRKNTAPGAKGATGAGALRILVVEDNDITQRVLQALVEKQGHKAIVASSAEEAIAFLEMGEQFDLVFSDINLTGVSGLEFTRVVRGMADERIRTLPIIALSGHVDDSDIAACQMAGMNGHLAKPIDPDLFAELIRRVERGELKGAQTTEPTVAGPTKSAPPNKENPGGRAHKMPDDQSGGPSPVSARPAAMPVGGVDQNLTEGLAQPTAGPPIPPSPPPRAADRVAPAFDTLEMDLIGTLRESLGDIQLRQLLDGLYIKAEEIITAMERQNPIDIEFTRTRAHELKGMCGNFGLQRLSDQARQVEQAIKAGDVANVGRVMGPLRQIYQQSRTEIDQWLGA